MEDEEMLETTNETEKVETETTEQNQEGNAKNLDTENEVEPTKTEGTVEEPAKTLTQAQIDAMVQDRINRLTKVAKRNEESIKKEYETKLADIENVIKAGFGTDNLDAGINRIKEICKTKGIEIPENKSTYSQSDLEVLAKHSADEIISDGYEAVDSELKRLANKGADKMSAKEKLIFTRLNDTKKVLESEKELAELGVKKEILESKEFKDFADKFAGSKFSMKEVYEMYSSTTKSKPKAKPLGSMVNNNPKEVKEFITEAEYDKMTDKEIEANMDLIRASMHKW